MCLLFWQIVRSILKNVKVGVITFWKYMILVPSVLSNRVKEEKREGYADDMAGRPALVRATRLASVPSTGRLES